MPNLIVLSRTVQDVHYLLLQVSASEILHAVVRITTFRRVSNVLLLISYIEDFNGFLLEKVNIGFTFGHYLRAISNFV